VSQVDTGKALLKQFPQKNHKAVFFDMHLLIIEMSHCQKAVRLPLSGSNHIAFCPRFLWSEDPR
jgi:hypothetical protein